jgi:predicted dinucleotide-utilizing enzyme
MPYNEKAIRRIERAVPERASKAIKAAYKEALHAGQDVLIVSNAKLYKIKPDGQREFIRDVPKRVAVTKGQKIRLH